MKININNILYKVMQISLVVTAGYLAMHNIDGWGWFLFIFLFTL